MNKKSNYQNKLYKSIKKLLTNNLIDYETFQHTTIIIKSGSLAGVILRPNKNYCSINSPMFGYFNKVQHGFSFCVNYSIETLLYKMYKFSVLDQKQYLALTTSLYAKV